MAQGKPSVEFWYDFASTYSYLSAMRIEALGETRGIEIKWRPFLLGPIFRAQGWDTSPFNIYPAKGRYMIRDLERLCRERGLDFRMPQRFPANSLKAARIALLGEAEGWTAAFSQAVYTAGFARGEDIADDAVLAAAGASLGLDFTRLSVAAERAEVKDRLRRQTADAADLGIFGAPTFRTSDGEIFWGDDRLEQALAWAKL